MTAGPPGSDKSEALSCGYGVQSQAVPAGMESPNAASDHVGVGVGGELLGGAPAGMKSPNAASDHVGGGVGGELRVGEAQPASTAVRSPSVSSANHLAIRCLPTPDAGAGSRPRERSVGGRAAVPATT